MKIEFELINGLGIEVDPFYFNWGSFGEYSIYFEIYQINDYENNRDIAYLFIENPLEGGTDGLIEKIKKLESIMEQHPLWFKGPIGVYGGIVIS